MTHFIRPYARFLQLVFLALLCAGALSVVNAQQISGEISGIVTDSSGARIPGATVVLTNEETREVVRTLKTNAQGAYTAPLLQVGTYRIEASSSGFTARSVDHIQVDVSAVVKIDLQLSPGSVENVTVVQANNLAPELENGAIGSVITGSEMRDLALNTRNFEQLLQLQPGVSYGGTTDEVYSGRVAPSGSIQNANLSINGLRPDQNAWLLDGADMLAHNTGAQVVAYPSIESIQELKTFRNSYGAQYGGGGNAQIQIITRAGTSAYHGDLHVFVRNAIFNANDYFNNLTGAARPQDDQYTGGLTFGGPVFIPHVPTSLRNNTFFFYALEVNRDAVANVQDIANVPPPAYLQGNFPNLVCTAYDPTGKCTSQGRTITTIDPVAQEYIKDIFSKFPAPNNPTDSQGLIIDAIGVHNETSQLVRIDHTFSSRLNAFFRYLYDPINLQTPNGYGLGVGYPGVSNSIIHTVGTAYLLHTTYALSSSTVLDASVSYQPYAVHARPVGALSAANSPDIHVTLPFASTIPTIPSLVFQNGSANVASVGPLDDENESFQVFGNIYHTIGRHSLSLGVNWELYREAVNQGTLNAGEFVFNQGAIAENDVTNPCVSSPTGAQACPNGIEAAFANFLLGHVTNFVQASIDPLSNAHVHMGEAYLQDDWRALSRLTINAGARYSIFENPMAVPGTFGSFESQYFNVMQAATIDTNGNICTAAPCAGGATPNSNYNPLNGIVQAGINSPYGSSVSGQPVLNLAPRVGFAWDVYGSGKTSLRGGYGIFFAQTQLNEVHQTVYNNPAYVQVVTYNSPASFANPGLVPSTAPLVAYGINATQHTPYVQGYSLDVQQQFSHRTLVDVAYSGNKSTHLPGQVDINQPYPGEFTKLGIVTVTSGNTPELNQIRPYPGYSTIVQEQTRFVANYNALQTSLNTGFNEDSRLSLSYTWSRGLSDAPAAMGQAPQNTYNLPAEYGLVNFDRRHVFTAHLVYTLPFYRRQRGWKAHVLGGWSTAAIVTAATGLPLTITAAVVDPAGQGLLGPNTPEVQRPDQVGGNPNDDAPHQLGAWFNVNHFVQVPTGQDRPGDSSVGNVRGPGYQVWNLDVFKNIDTSARTHLQFRVEAFNTFNHTNWATIDTVMNGSASFGTIRTDRNPRDLQLGARFFF